MMGHRSKPVALGLGALVLASAGDVQAAPVVTPTSSIVDHAAAAIELGVTRTYPYLDGETYVVIAVPGRITDIVLEAGEKLVGTGPIAAGDTTRWVIGDTTSGDGGAQRVHVLVKPTLPALATNLIINTDRRTYHLELRSAERGWLTQVAWRYPDPPPAAPAPVVAVEPDIARLNFAYQILGAKVAWRPSRVFDDGARTYVEFGPSIVMADLPPLFAVGADGKSAELINYHVAGRRIVVDRLIDRAELRMGQGRGEKRVRLSREPVR